MADTKISAFPSDASLDGTETVASVQGGVNSKIALSVIDTYFSQTTKTLTNKSLSVGQITGLGTGVATALAANVNGSGAISLTTSPTFVTPVLGVAAATSLNKVTITTPATGSTLTIADGKTLTVSNTLTLTATDGSTLAIGGGGTLGTAAYQNTGTSGATIPFLNGTNTWGGVQTFTTPVIGAATGTSLTLSSFLRVGDGTGAAPSVSFGSDTGLGFFRRTANVMGWSSGGAQDLDIGSGFIRMTAAGALRWTAGSDPTAASELTLLRDAANTLAQRNGTTAQLFRSYATFTDASNYQRGYFDVGVHAANYVTIGGEAAGTGGAMGLQFSVGTTLVDVFYIDRTTRHLQWNTDNTYDIGSLGASRPRNIFIAGAGTFGSGITAGAQIITTATGYQAPATGLFYWTTRSRVRSSADGLIELFNAAENDFTRLNFGGVTASFGAIARDGAGLKIVGGDGTSVSWIKVPGVTVANLPSASTAGAGALSFVTDASTTLVLGLGGTVTGGGANKVPVYSDGTNWVYG